jgi:penicillin-binding protein 1C
VDLRAMARAVAQAVWNGGVVSGGSTLTMQVARLLEESGTGRSRASCGRCGWRWRWSGG